ncbi:MAG: DUF2059 domain-containing protein [Candidatus Omnitrophica bacterium]|nr:DUF2059 domain-containing protein [Candidatus Omnitrophota bacterium]
MNKIAGKILCVFTILFLVLSFSSFAQTDELSQEKKADIKKLLEITNALQISQQIGDFFNAQMTQQIKLLNPQISPERFEIIRQEVDKVVAEAMYEEDGYVGLTTKLYHKYYTHKDIKEIIKFYQSEVGKKVIKVTPALLQESMVVGQIWGKRLEPRIKERIIKRFKEEANIEISL